MGTGLGQGHPSLTPIANSDYIYAALGEELGLTGLMAILMLYLLIIAAGMITAMKIKDGFGKLLASGLVFTMAFQVFTVVGGITLVIPLTGLTLPYMAAGGSSLIANYMLAALLMVISNSANKPESDIDSDTFQYEAMQALSARKQSRARRSVASEQSAAQSQAVSQAAAQAVPQVAVPAAMQQSQATEIISTGTLSEVSAETPVAGTPTVPPAPPSNGFGTSDVPNPSGNMSEGSQA